MGKPFKNWLRVSLICLSESVRRRLWIVRDPHVDADKDKDREERAAWRDTQKMQEQADVDLAKIQADAEEKSRADDRNTSRNRREKEV